MNRQNTYRGLENFLDLPQFTLDTEEIEYPNKDDEFVIRVLEKMNRQTRYFNKDGKDKMYYVRTLTFPLAKAGKFKSKITNFKVTNYCK